MKWELAAIACAIIGTIHVNEESGLGVMWAFAVFALAAPVFIVIGLTT